MNPGPEIRIAASDAEIGAALEVRRAVFVREQGGPSEEEPDTHDSGARHYVVYDGGRPVGAARLLDGGKATARIGRVCLIEPVRGRGWAALLMRRVIEDARCLGARELVLDAQLSAIQFYERLGFAAEGEVFDDVGIPHRRMRRRLG
jgi:predicted GNAT family N-acyltransferase